MILNENDSWSVGCLFIFSDLHCKCHSTLQKRKKEEKPSPSDYTEQYRLYYNNDFG